MEAIVIGLVVGLLKEAVPAVISMVKESNALDESQKKELLARISVELDGAKARVAAVTFRDV